MATTGISNIVHSAPPYRYRHNVADDSAAKDYFIHRRRRDRADANWHSVRHWPNRAFVLMPLKPRSRTERPDSQRGLTDLPVELLLDIFDILAPVDAHTLRTVCKYTWMLSVTNRIDNCIRELHDDAADEHAWRLRKDRFNRLAEYEEANDEFRRYTPRDKLLCSYCVDFHPLSAFEPLKRERGAILANQRQCIASAATIYFCPHRQMAFEDLIRLYNSPEQERQCPACVRVGNSAVLLLKRVHGFTLIRTIPVSRLSEETISNTLRAHNHSPALVPCNICEIGRFPGSDPPSKAMKALEDLDVYVCPHIYGKTEARSMLKSITEGPDVHPVCKHIIGHGHVVMREDVRLRSRCQQDGCAATLLVILDEFGVMIQVINELQMTTVMTEDWQVSTQTPAI